jgi:hypothetical protein
VIVLDDYRDQKQIEQAIDIERALRDFDLAIKMSLRTRKSMHGGYWCADVGIRYAIMVTRVRLRRLGVK